MSEDEKFYEADEVEGKYIEVMLQDAEREEYVYWLDLSKLPDGEDEHDWAIDQAKKFHTAQGLPVIPDDDEASDDFDEATEEDTDEDFDDFDDFDEEPYASAYEPFSRSESEFTFIT